MSAASRAWIVASSIGAVEALKDQLGVCRWNHALRSLQQHAKSNIRSYTQAKTLSSATSAAVSNKVKRTKEESMRKVMDLSCWGPNTSREEDRFRDSPEILDKFFKFLFVIIALKTTSMGAVLFESHPIVTNAMVLMTVLFYLLWLLGVTTLLSQRIGTLPTRAFRHFMLVVGSICSVLILSTISTLIAWLTAMLWIIFLTVTGYFCYRELYEWAAHAISDTINRWIHSYTQSGRRLPV
ncbi:hypothetical protein GmHk_13G038860 [Glycine max]|nr:hypothetical protein GmHk_13G038860 [Glycine max]